jgi:hypothetical protein
MISYPVDPFYLPTPGVYDPPYTTQYVLHSLASLIVPKITFPTSSALLPASICSWGPSSSSSLSPTSPSSGHSAEEDKLQERWSWERWTVEWCSVGESPMTSYPLQIHLPFTNFISYCRWHQSAKRRAYIKSSFSPLSSQLSLTSNLFTTTPFISLA